MNTYHVQVKVTGYATLTILAENGQDLQDRIHHQEGFGKHDIDDIDINEVEFEQIISTDEAKEE
ncbi:MAG: hypothetical protein WC441_04720 [Patescibacteria group bacterium]